MRKEITRDVESVINDWRSAFMSAYAETEEIRAELLTETERLETKKQAEKALYESVAALRGTLCQIIADYQGEVDRVRAECREVGAAKAERKKLEARLSDWINEIGRAKNNRALGLRGVSDEVIMKLESEKPDPESITIPEVTPVDEQIEARGVAALQELAVAMNDCTLAIIARRHCQERIAELTERLEAAEVDLIDKRKEFEKELNSAVHEHETRIRAASAKREQEINALKKARDATAARLKALGVDD